MRIRILGILVVAALCAPVDAGARTFYMSPAGRDRASGLTEFDPWQTFRNAFSHMRAGDELVLLDGLYSEAAGTGYISYLGDNSAQIPSGIDVSHPTRVHAQHPGSVFVVGQLFIGRSDRKDSFITIQGLTFEGGGALYNTSFITITDTGFHSADESGGAVFGIGTNDHAHGNSDNLIQDVWIWGRERGMAVNYRSDRNVWRRVVIRGDGCRSDECTGDGNPNVGISVYESANTSLQNVIVVDRILDGGSPYADFAVAQHTRGLPHGNNEWLGTISLRAPDSGYYFEPDQVTMMPAHRLRNCIAWDAAGGGINVARSGINDIQNCTVKTLSDDAVRVAPDLSGGTLQNLIVMGAGRFGVNSAYQPKFVAMTGTWSEDAYNQTTCEIGCRPLPEIFTYLLRVEPGSPLKSTASAGADYGANVEFRYGADGTRFGEPDFNVLTARPLWPWPNEDRIAREMCAGVARGFCARPSLTEYIWTYLGAPVPAALVSTARRP